jgi:TPR repeat protein
LRKRQPKGNADAQTMLGGLYDQGYDVPQDYVTARGWYEKAAAQGNGDAQNNLGVLYVYGNGVQPDYTTARQWFEKAAAQGVVWAQFRLGEMYLKGLGGLPKNLVQAHLWLSMAVTQGNNLSRLERDEVAKKMTPAQIAEAQRLAQQCQAQQFKGC